MIEKTFINIKKEVVNKATCLFCGEKTYDRKNHKPFETGWICISFGFGSKYDDEWYEEGLCDGCFEKIIKPKLQKKKKANN